MIAGKGTVASCLKDQYGVAHISTGDLLRDEMKLKTELGAEVQKYVEGGELVPDEVVTKMIKNKFENDPSVEKGFMLDGFPRTKQQAKDLDDILNKRNNALEFAVYLDASLPVIIQRLTGRRVCKNCGAIYHMDNKLPQKEGICDKCDSELYQRADDNEETIKTRMDVYMENTKPIISYYKQQGKLKTIDADRNSDLITEDLVKIFNENGKLN